MKAAVDGTFTDVTYELADGVARVAINRPKVLNAFTPVTLRELITVFTDAKDNDDVGVIVLTGVGDRAFCVGGDMNWEASDEYEDGSGMALAQQLYAQFRDCLKPIIARVNGYAIGGGNHLAYHCDFTIAADHAIFGQNGPRVASPAEGSIVSFLAEAIGVKRAKEMWMLCRRYSAQEALDWGLANVVVPMDKLDEEVDKWCEELSTRPSSIRASRRKVPTRFSRSAPRTSPSGAESLPS